MFLPGGVEVSQMNDGPQRVETPTLLATMGPVIFVPLLIPVILTGIPLLFTRRASKGVSIATTVVLAVFASASIGWFHLPATIIALVSLFVPSRKRAKP